MAPGRQALVSIKYTAGFRDLTASQMNRISQPKGINGGDGENADGMPKGLVQKNKKILEPLRKRRLKQVRQPHKPPGQGPLQVRKEVLHQHSLLQLPRLTIRLLLPIQILGLVAEISLSPRARHASRSLQRWKQKRRRSAKKLKKSNARDLPNSRRVSISMLSWRELVVVSSISILKIVILICLNIYRGEEISAL